MEYTYQIIKAHQLIVEEISGNITLEKLAEKTERLFSDPDYDVSYAGVIDLRNADAQITKAELYGFANYINLSDKFGKAKWALIAQNPAVVAIAQIFQQRLNDPNNISISNSVEAAALFLQNPGLLQYLKD